MTSSAERKRLLTEAVERSAWDPVYFCRFFLPHWFPTAMPAFHIGLLALMTKKVEFLDEYPDVHEFLLTEFWYQADPDDPTSVKLPVFQKDALGHIIMVAGDHNNVIIPRGFSKTTLTNAVNLYMVLTDGTTFCVYLSKSAPHAQMQLGNIRAEIEGNELLREAYGNVVPCRSDIEKWQSDQLQLLNGAILVARGKGGQVRGLNFRARRPNRIVLDDVQDDGEAISPTIMEQDESWFYSAVEKAGVDMEGAEGSDGAQQKLQITNLGTLLGSQCLMMSLSRDPSYNTIKFGAKLHLEDANDKRMLWPYKMSYEKYARDRERHRKVGRLAEFTRELDSAIRVSDDAIFPERFVYQLVVRQQLVAVGQALDPAISDQPGADSAALVVVGRREDGQLFVLDEWGGQGKTPREKIDAFFEYHLKWQTTHNGIEAVQYQKALIYLMREEMMHRKYFFHIVPILQGRAQTKIQRIVGILSPRYTNGYIQHLRPLPGLEGNLSDWPNGKKDFADAAAMAMTLMGETAGLALPEEEEAALAAAQHSDDYGPLPPAFRQVSNQIIRNAVGRPGQRDMSRYGYPGRFR